MEQLQLPDAHFDGETYDPEFDYERLKGQLLRTYKAMMHFSPANVWVTLKEIEAQTGDPQASISARIRDLRKPKFGSHNVHRRRRSPLQSGIWEYLLHLRLCQCDLCNHGRYLS